MTLTRKVDVLAVLRSGGYVVVDSDQLHPQLAHLFDCDGIAIDAWQTAIRSNLPGCILVDGRMVLRGAA